MDLNFASDNIVGASRPVLDAIVRANDGSLPSYGADALTTSVVRRLSAIFERDVQVFLVATGTGANALALAAAMSPFGLCLCHEEAHVVDDECGAPEFFTGGAKLHGLPGVGCKLLPADVSAALDRMPAAAKQMPPQALSISQATESGLVYRPDEVAALGELARSRGLALHMDGARFANALVRLGCTAAEITWKAGVDVLSFGGTKNGCLAAEAIVVFEPALARNLDYLRKRSGHTLSKGRLLAAQFDGYLADDHWLANARHANATASRLSDGLVRAGARLAWPTDANEVFAILPAELDGRLRAAGAVFYPWSPRALPPGDAVAPGEVLVRFVTSFATPERAVDALLAAAGDRRRDAAG